jgi:hypothetical protein
MSRRRALMALAAGAAVAAASCQSRQPSDGDWLLTPAESQALDSAPMDPLMNVESRGPGGDAVVLIRTDGPILEFVQPSAETLSLTSPIDVVVRFRPKSAAPDLETLSVKACKQTFLGCLGNQDVTTRLKAFTTVDGISASGLQVPAGTFRFKFEIADLEGNRTIGSVRVKIVS